MRALALSPALTIVSSRFGPKPVGVDAQATAGADDGVTPLSAFSRGAVSMAITDFFLVEAQTAGAPPSRAAR